MDELILEVFWDNNDGGTWWCEIFKQVVEWSDVPYWEKKKYYTVVGKTRTYHIKGMSNYEQAKAFAIWHYTREQAIGDQWIRLA